MAYEYKKFKKNKSSIIPVEEIYTDLDINANDPYEPSTGYRFDSPRRWCNDSSANKSIGIRDLHLTPSSGDIRCRFLSFGHITLSGEEYTWNRNNPDSQEDQSGTYEPTNEATPVIVTDDLATFRCFSDTYTVQLTPQNCFEEIITAMMDFINANAWKGLYKRGVQYRVYRSNSETSRTNFYDIQPAANSTNYTPTTYIVPINYLHIPYTFRYYYDSNTCQFNFETNDYTRKIIMKDNTNSTNEVLNDAKFATFTKNTHYYYDEDTDLNSKKDSHDKIVLTNSTPVIKASELLLIIKRDDTNSIKAVYDLFNQKMPDIKTLPVIKCDDIYYVIPFVESGYISNFKYGKVDEHGAFAIDHNEQTPVGFRTNLKLDNVWDRIHLIYHASFAETRHRIIGRNNDHWNDPNKMFMVPSGDQDQFYIRFTTDGIHNILPIGCHFNVDLTFMLNPTKNTATGVQSNGNHDSFKD